MLTLDGAPVDAVPADLALYPYGVFTTLVVDDGTVLGWEDHLARLHRDAARLWGHVLDPDHVTGLVRAHLGRLGGAEARVTVRVTLYPAAFSLAAPETARGCRVLVSTRPAGPPSSTRANGIAVATRAHRRALPEVKSTDLVGTLLLRREARLAGHDDVLLVDGEQVLEGATWSVLVWRGGEVATPDGPVLPSTTVQHLRPAVEALGRALVARPVTSAELAEADLVLAVNATQPHRPVTAVDGTRLRVEEDLLTAVAQAYAGLRRRPV
ncbi:aminotransferase class IV [Nocardioides bruguierae]|uniref:Aminotransferase class IV n=1 Tax=Nocardioides bruguierae TaxID=2945102 RepID=A0A9X2D5N6_9ACTN|nr:aminotransferase class IV [Nocardioides bruguierae]MCM0619292.1 aminotransferase class IV [Nocardioides bruguierae]